MARRTGGLWVAIVIGLFGLVGCFPHSYRSPAVENAVGETVQMRVRYSDGVIWNSDLAGPPVRATIGREGIEIEEVEFRRHGEVLHRLDRAAVDRLKGNEQEGMTLTWMVSAQSIEVLTVRELNKRRK